MRNLLFLTTIVLLILKLSNNIQISYLLVFVPVILFAAYLVVDFSILKIREKQLRRFLETHSTRMEIANKLDLLSKEGKKDSKEYKDLELEIKKIKRKFWIFD